MIFKIITLIFTMYPTLSVAKKVAITIDDTVAADGAFYSSIERSKKIINTLNEEAIEEIIFFSVTNRLNTKENIFIINDYLKNGHIIGNHTHSHMAASKVSLTNFTQDTSMAINKLKELKIDQKYFRFPYLDRGPSRSYTNSFLNFLEQNSLIDSYVTMVTYDWYLDELFQKDMRLGNKVNLDELKRLYISSITVQMETINKAAQSSNRTNIHHVLLLHENDLTAMFLQDLIKAIRNDGWEIVKASEAYLPANYLQLDNNNQDENRCSIYHRIPNHSVCATSPTKSNIKTTYERSVLIEKRNLLSIDYILYKVGIYLREIFKYYL